LIFVRYMCLAASLPTPFFSPHTPTTELYTLSLHDALPIYAPSLSVCGSRIQARKVAGVLGAAPAASVSRLIRCVKSGPNFPWAVDRKSTRLNSSHGSISYAVFCLKKKNKSKIYSHDFDTHT